MTKNYYKTVLILQDSLDTKFDFKTVLHTVKCFYLTCVIFYLLRQMRILHELINVFVIAAIKMFVNIFCPDP